MAAAGLKHPPTYEPIRDHCLRRGKLDATGAPLVAAAALYVPIDWTAERTPVG